MICDTCGKENPDGNWVCGQCGAILQRPPEPLQDPDTQVMLAERPAPLKPQKNSGLNVITKLAIAVVVLGAAAAAAVWYFHYRGPDTGTPRGTMETYVNAISNGDCETIYDLTPSSEVPADRSTAVSACSQFAGLLNISFSDYKTVEETINGNQATVTFQLTVKAGGQSAASVLSRDLIMENGQWKVQPGTT